MKLECNYVQLPKIYSYLTGNEFKVFTVIYDEWTMMKNENGWFYRSQKLLSKDSGLPLRTLQRTLKKLIEKGVILTTFYNDGVKMATYNKANEYKINLEVVYKLCKKGVKMTTEGCQNGAPSNNPISNNNNIYKHNIPEHEVTGKKENKKEINKEKIKEKESDQSSLDVKVSEPENKIFNKENEMSDNGTNGMSAISEQSERQAKENESSGCDKINEMKSSKSGDQNKIEDKVTSPKVSPSSKDDMAIDPNNSDVNANKASGDLKNPSMDKLSNPIEKMESDAPESPKTEFKRTSNDGNGGHKVQSGKVIDDCSIFGENCPKPYPPQIPPTPPFPLNKAAGDLKNPSMEQLPTNEIKTRQNAPESPQIEFDEKWYNETYALMDNFKTNEDLDELYTRFKQSNNKRMINDFKCKVWKRYDLDNGLQNKLSEMFREFRRMIA